MRILQILHNRKFGGAEQHLVQLCTGLRAAGHEIEAAVPRGSWVWLRLEEAGFVLHDFDFQAHYDLPALLRLLVLIKRRGLRPRSHASGARRLLWAACLPDERHPAAQQRA